MSDDPQGAALYSEEAPAEVVALTCASGLVEVRYTDGGVEHYAIDAFGEWAEESLRVARTCEALRRLKAGVAWARTMWDETNAVRSDQSVVAWAAELLSWDEGFPAESVVQNAEGALVELEETLARVVEVQEVRQRFEACVADAAQVHDVIVDVMNDLYETFDRVQPQVVEAVEAVADYHEALVAGSGRGELALIAVSNGAFAVFGVAGASVFTAAAITYGAGAGAASVIGAATAGGLGNALQELGKQTGEAQADIAGGFDWLEVLKQGAVGGLAGGLAKWTEVFGPRITRWFAEKACERIGLHPLAHAALLQPREPSAAVELMIACVLEVGQQVFIAVVTERWQTVSEATRDTDFFYDVFTKVGSAALCDVIKRRFGFPADQWGEVYANLMRAP